MANPWQQLPQTTKQEMNVVQTSLGMLEFISIPAGIEAADSMLKVAEVELVTAQPVCAGKYIVIISGEVSAVKSSIETGSKSAGVKLINSLIIPNVDTQVPRAIGGYTDIGPISSVGAIETYSLCSAVQVADAAVKAAEVTLIEIRLGRGLGGKSYVTLTGDVSAVETAAKAAAELEEVQGLLADSVVIPSIHPDLGQALL